MSADNQGTPIAGVPEPTHKVRRVQVAVSIFASSVALHLPQAYNLAIYPFAAAILALSSSLQRSHAKAHGLDLRYYSAESSLPPRPTAGKAKQAPAQPHIEPQSPGLVGLILGLILDMYARSLGALTNAVRGLPDKQPIYIHQPSSSPPVSSAASENSVSTLKPEDQSIHAARNFVQPYLDAGLTPPMPECWGHRGASGVFPENTMASFYRAVEDGSEGIETDVYITKDDQLVLFHDPALDRTTDGHGLIENQNWFGGIELVRTKQAPVQQIPLFGQLCDLMMRPDCHHVKANLDIKPDNDPDRLFRLMGETVRKYPNWQTDLAPRLLLGLWHPKFIPSAVRYVPELTRMHIGGSPSVARQYFWPYVDGFSMYFSSLMVAEGQAFLRDAKAAGKKVTVWTVNLPDEMIESARWGVDAVLTDNTSLFQRLRQDLQKDFVPTECKYVSRYWAWSRWRYYFWPVWVLQTSRLAMLEVRAKQAFGFTPEQKQVLDSLYAVAKPNAR